MWVGDHNDPSVGIVRGLMRDSIGARVSRRPRSVALCAVAVLVWACTAPTSQSPEASAGAPSPTPVGTASMSPSFAWTAIDEDAIGGVELGPIVALGSDVLAIGSPFGVLPAGGAWAHPTLWRSADGLRWNQLSPPSAFSGVRNAWIDTVSGVTGREGRFVAVGAQISDDGSTANAEAWTSPDGSSWARSTVDGAFGATMDLVVQLPDGYAAIGANGFSGHAGFGHGTAIWTSSDGTHWSRLPQTEVPAGVSIASVSHGPAGFFGVGIAEPPGGSADTFRPIWTSLDAVHWQMLGPITEVSANAGLAGVVWAGSSYVAVGDEPTVGSFAWQSTDGTAWTSTQLPALVNGTVAPQSDVAGLAVTPVGLLAIGFVSDGGGRSHSAMWQASLGGSSTSALHWTRLALPSTFDDVTLTSIAVVGQLVFVTGETPSGSFRAWLVRAGS
jgi:hypothetical protein